MDADRFETLLRTLHGTPTRRLTLRSLAVLGLATFLGHQESEAKTNKGRKGKGNKKGKGKTPPCVGNCSGKSCGDDGCGGSCGTCPVDKICQGVTCVCPPGQQDSGGVCATEPICGGSLFCAAPSECCSASCLGGVCVRSSAGLPCQVTNDCEPA